MIVYYNNKQEKLFKQLEKMHSSSPKINLNDSIEKLKCILLNKPQYFLMNVQVNRDGLLGSLRRIKWAYCEYEKAPLNYEGSDKREALTLVFFHNSKCFIEIFKKCFPKFSSNKKNKKVFYEITTIRNLFAHSYEKDFFGKKTFIRININHHFNKGLFELEVFNFDTSEKIYGIFFSLLIFLSEIEELVKELIKHIKEN